MVSLARPRGVRRWPGAQPQPCNSSTARPPPCCACPAAQWLQDTLAIYRRHTRIGVIGLNKYRCVVRLRQVDQHPDELAPAQPVQPGAPASAREASASHARDLLRQWALEGDLAPASLRTAPPCAAHEPKGHQASDRVPLCSTRLCRHMEWNNRWGQPSWDRDPQLPNVAWGFVDLVDFAPLAIRATAYQQVGRKQLQRAAAAAAAVGCDWFFGGEGPFGWEGRLRGTSAWHWAWCTSALVLLAHYPFGFRGCRSVVWRRASACRPCAASWVTGSCATGSGWLAGR
jgi:hypothetical protein